MKQRTNMKRMSAFVAGLALVVAACGSDGDAPVAGGPGPVDSTGASPTTTTIEPSEDGRGWIDGEPQWKANEEEGGLSYAAEGDSADVAASSGAADSRDIAAESELREAPIPVEPDGGIGDGAGPIPIEESPPVPFDEPIEQPIDNTPLRAGSVDDNADYEGFLAYLDRIAGLGVVTRDLDASGRSIITVTDPDGRPAPGVVVEASAGDVLVNLRTTADGTIRFHPAFYGIPTDATIGYGGLDLADGPLTEAPAGADVALVTPTRQDIDTPTGVPLDVLFLLDATGSMGDEIDRLKATIDIVAERVAALDPAPDVRFAMTLYRDETDAFLTANYDFTGDIAEFQSALADVVADGGGDYPEALDEGLADALAKPSWRDPADAVQLIFVVADAPPQVGRQVPTPYTDSVRTAVERGIKIFPIASSESDDQAEAVFRQLAQATGAPFVFLSNGAAGAATGGSTDIQSTDYEELALDELVVRLIAEELSDLRGGSGGGGQVTVPTTTPAPTTNPDGQ